MSGKRASGGNNKEGFGAPKPLPGQPGYKMAESAILEKEAKEMELRLQVLQDRLMQQQLEAEKTQKTSANGCRWKSSNPEKGSVRAYGKEVTEKFKTKTLERDNSKSKMLYDPSPVYEEQPPPLPPKKSTPPSQTQTQGLSAGKEASKDVGSWTTADVGNWLVSQLQLPQYQEVFAKNEINGEMLIDMTLDDLDYLNITVLGHRKTIMKAVEEFRRQLKSNGFSVKQNLAPSSLQRVQSAPNGDEGFENDDLCVGKSVAAEKKVAPTKPVHWSQVEPISNKQVKGGLQAINAADEEPLDEEAERLAFMRAVEEWRKGDAGTAQKKVTIVREFGGKPASSAISDVTTSHFSLVDGADSGGMWKNPFAPVEPSPRINSSLLEGKLDEDHERAEFIKAVEAWRSNNKKTDQNNPNNSKTAVTSARVESNSSGVSESVLVGESSILSAKSVAENLAKKMEEEQREVVRKIQKQKEDAERRLLQANQELQQLRLVKEHNGEPLTLSPRISGATPRQKELDENKFTYSKAPLEMNVSFNDSDNDEPSSKRSWDEREWKTRNQDNSETARPSTVKISLVESVIGSPDEFLPTEDSTMCVIECDSDDE